eukprot:gene13184-17667_t
MSKRGGSAALAAMLMKQNSEKREDPQAPAVDPSKCTVCAKTVYKPEETIAVGRTWHNSCFTCGGTASDGCNRVLKRTDYVDHGGEPYCKACYTKLFGPKGFGYSNTLNTDYGEGVGATSDSIATLSLDNSRSLSPPKPSNPPPPPPTAVTSSDSSNTKIRSTSPTPIVAPPPPPIHSNSSNNSTLKPSPPPPQTSNVTAESIEKTRSTSPSPTKVVPPPPIPATNKSSSVTVDSNATTQNSSINTRSISPKALQATAANSTPKCTICAKSVYKMEEIIAIGVVWHTACFTCGGKENNGCGKVLKRTDYVDHEGQPYCNPCYSKLYRPVGFGYGNSLNTDYGPSPDTVKATRSTSPTPQAKKPVPPPPTTTTATKPVSTEAPTYNAPVLPANSTDVDSIRAPRLNPPRPSIMSVNVPTQGSSIAIGASSKATDSLHKEASYVGDNDEVDESEW